MRLTRSDGFNARVVLPVRPPFRLDYTTDALLRVPGNLVDVVRPDGAYYRALSDARGTSVVRVVQLDAERIEVCASGRGGERFVPQVGRMLGIDVDVAAWRRRSAKIGWLKGVAQAFAGLKPPRYSCAWEACAHAIVFAQISIHAGGAIMRRLVEALGEEIAIDGVRPVPFPAPERLLDAPDAVLRGVGLSGNKAAYLRTVAAAVREGRIDDATLEGLPTAQAAEVLTGVRGLGTWSAAVVMLRGFGRIDTFPMRDSGVARSIALLSGDPDVDLDAVLGVLGPTRGMLYYHLLLGRLHPEALG